MFCTGSENRAAREPQGHGLPVLVVNSCSKRLITTVSSCLIFKVKMATQSTVSEPWSMHPDGICVCMGWNFYIQLQALDS